jgi:carboxymethylenebutenolidase
MDDARPVRTVTLEAPDGLAEAFVAQPVGAPRGAVLVFMDAFGLRPRLADMCARIADWGYGVVAPNVFYRSGSVADLAPRGSLLTPEGRAAFFTSAVKERIDGYSTAYGRADAPAWLDALRSQFGELPVGASGYCFGARLATKIAGDHPHAVRAVGGWHGAGLATEAPDSPHTFVATAAAAFHYGHADNDPAMPPQSVAVLERALEAAGVEYRNEVFAGAQHGYTMADTASYGAMHEARHWAALESLFDRSLAAAG